MSEYPCKFEDRIIEFAEDIAEIKSDVKALSVRTNGNMDRFIDHIKQGHVWRTAILSMAVTLVISISGFLLLFGGLKKTVEVNERIIQREVLRENGNLTKKERT